MTVTIEVDQDIRRLETDAATIRELLAEAGISLGELDRVNPDLNFSVRPGITVRVTRVVEEFETEMRTIPFEQRIVVNEALPPGEQRLAQLGVNGQEEIVTRITYEDGVEVSRVQTSRTVVQAPVEEILVVGTERTATSIPIKGSIAYLSGGNAWLMRNNSGARRPLTTAGDLDGRVFDLSPDGRRLLYTRTVTDGVDAPLNELWMIDTRIIGEAPISLPIKGVLYAAWSPLLTETVIAYSTAERVPSPPGWRANNDLWLWDMSGEPEQAVEIVPANTDGLYAWWGTNYAWSPDGTAFAYANAGQVGVIDVVSKMVMPLKEFAPYETDSNWVWTPTVSWSPDSRFIATVIHGDPIQNERPEASPVFDVWLLGRDGRLKVKAWERAGMWSNPVWYAGGIAFGRAINPLNSVGSRYQLAMMDWDASNSRLLFPPSDALGVDLPQIVWQPNSDELSFLFVNRNNLYLYRANGLEPHQLTSDGQSFRPDWVIPAEVNPGLTDTPPITQTTDISATPAISIAAPLTPATTIKE